MRIDGGFGVVCVHALLFPAVTYLLRPTAAYRAIELDVPTALLGLLVASFALVPLVLALPAGMLLLGTHEPSPTAAPAGGLDRGLGAGARGG